MNSSRLLKHAIRMLVSDNFNHNKVKTQKGRLSLYAGEIARVRQLLSIHKP